MKAFKIKVSKEEKKQIVKARRLKQAEIWKACSIVKDRLFVQEIINDLVKRNGKTFFNTKAGEMLRDWSMELRTNSGLAGKTKLAFREVVGIQNWMK